jgi:hypothetical protein
MNRIILKFRSAFSEAQLDETEFQSILSGRTLVCRRGQMPRSGSKEGTFLWTGGVLGLCALLVKAKIASLLPSSEREGKIRAEISSDLSDCARALDSALAKRPNWILDMFGTDSAGAPIVQRMFSRRNPERKRPGPVTISLSTSFLEPAGITIMLDGARITDVSLLRPLLEQIGFVEQAADVSASRDVIVSHAPGPKGALRVLLPFLDHYVLALSGYGASAKLDAFIEAECRLALRVALLMADTVYVPAVSYVQSPLCRKLLDEHRSHAQLGAIRLLTDAPTWKEFLKVRRGEYPRRSSERQLYLSATLSSSLEEYPMHPTEIDTTEALHKEWAEAVQRIPFQSALLRDQHHPGNDGESCAEMMRCAADNLGSLAFIGRHLRQSLRRQNVQVPETRLTRIICDLFFSHFCSHAELDVFDDLAFVRRVDIPGTHRRHHVGALIRELRAQEPDVFTSLVTCDSESIWGLSSRVLGQRLRNE